MVLNIIKVKLIVVFYLFLYVGCCSFGSTTKREYYFKTYLSEEFIANKNDSAIFIDQNNNLFIFNKVSYDRYIDERNECRHCCEDNRIEKAELNYFSTTIPFSFIFENIADKKSDYFRIVHNNSRNNNDYLFGRFNYVNDRMQTDSIYLKNSPVVTHFATLKIINNTFNNVYLFEEIISTPKKYPQKIYYSSEKGIVGIIFNNNDTWELVE